MVTDDDQTNISEDDKGEMSSASGEPSEKEEDERDEVKEVHKLSQKETARVRMGKLLVLVSILATAALVSTGTYIFLKKEEDADYNNSVRIPFLALRRREYILRIWYICFCSFCSRISRLHRLTRLYHPTHGSDKPTQNSFISSPTPSRLLLSFMSTI
jgi:hypothetical protein